MDAHVPLAPAGGVAIAQEMPGAPPALAIGRRAITVLEADAASRTVTIFERIELRNDGDAPFEPSMSGSQGPMGLLRFALPRNAFDLTLDDRLSAYDVIQVDRGFASLLPLPPGTTNVQFSYRVPYAGADYELATNAVYPTESLLLLLPDDFTTTSADLRLDRTADIGQQKFKVMTADDLAAGQRVSVTLGALPYTPRPWYLDETLQRAVAVVLAALGALFALGYARVRGSAAPAVNAAPARVADATDA
ncbi:MAG TPA: hypothetical protein VII06_29500 [Chloroflexota bacterium]